MRDFADRLVFLEASTTAAKSFQDQLPIDEGSYRFVHVASHSDARAYYLYGVMNEVIKATTAMIRWNIIFQESEKERNKEIVREKIGSLILESIVDEQHLWKRKLTEILVDLICFSGTNEQDYYRAYLAAAKLKDYLGLQFDFKTFYKCENKNINNSIEEWLHRINEIGRTIDLKQSWFVRNINKIGKDMRPGEVFNAIANRFRKALQNASELEKIVLGLSYADSISYTSRSLHPHIGGISSRTELQSVDRNIFNLSILAVQIVLRSHHLSGIEPTGMNKELIRVIEQQSIAAELLGQQFEPGDLVIVYTDLAEVLEVRKSDYGYNSYKVRYLSRAPIPGVDDKDWFPARYVHNFIKKEGARDFFRKNLEKNPGFKEGLDIIMQMSDEELYKIMRAFFINMAEKGLLG